MHEVIGKDERLTQAVGILIGETLAVEVGSGGVHDAVVIWAQDDNVATDIRTSLGEILDVVGLSKGHPILWEEILAAHLAAVLVVRLETVREELIAHKLLNAQRFLRDRVQDRDAIVVVDCREGALRSELLSDARSGNELQRRSGHLGKGPLDVGSDEPL